MVVELRGEGAFPRRKLLRPLRSPRMARSTRLPLNLRFRLIKRLITL
jgi:hypothetical protein